MNKFYIDITKKHNYFNFTCNNNLEINSNEQ